MLEKTLTKGQKVLLDIKDSARRRVVCGLRWDPAPEGDPPHDLDLMGLVFDKYGRLLNGITGEEGQRIGDSGNIYHTGDVIDGEDSLDDEQISLELFNISRKIHQIFFIAEVQSDHMFGNIANPEIRIANAIDDRNFAHAFLGENEGGDTNSYIFGSIYRTPRGWFFKYIGDYFEGHEVADWATTLKPFMEVEEGTEGENAPKAPPVPTKGESVPLYYTKEARHRIVCGLNWDPGKNEQYDLDLACVVYGEDKAPLDGVSPKSDETIDESGKIYHSGDDTSGEGDAVDDESISVELRDLPEDIHHIIFIAEIQSAHNFDQVLNPSLRIADGKTNEDQLLKSLATSESTGKNACVFARISRAGEGWVLTCIDEYFNGQDIEDWIEHLQPYLD